jgi:hypothetical protein
MQVINGCAGALMSLREGVARRQEDDVGRHKKRPDAAHVVSHRVSSNNNITFTTFISI